jgi:hypothetical protein
VKAIYDGMNSVTVRRNGAVRTLPCGFSFTTLIFGFWPSVIRGHWQFALLSLLPELVFLFTLVTGPYPFLWLIGGRIIIATVRNEMLINRYLNDGWSPHEHSRMWARNHGRGVGANDDYEDCDYGGTD